MTQPVRKPVLDPIVADVFRELLRGSMVLGSRLESRVEGGEFWVWVPDELAPVDPGRFREDIFWLGSFDIGPALQQHLAEFLISESNGLVIADTFCYVSDPKPNWASSVGWFSLRNPLIRDDRAGLCAFLQRDSYNPASFHTLMRAASHFTMTLTLTSTARAGTLHSGMNLDSNPGVVEELLERTREVMVGIFDETTMLVWQRESGRHLLRFVARNQL